MNEKELITKIYHELKQDKPNRLKLVDKHVNFASKKFRELWSRWYKGETPPNIEIDLVLIFEDIKEEHDEALIIAIEAKYIKTLQKNFFEGVDQIMAYSLFGFDGLCLWHLFSEEISDEDIEAYVNAVNEIFKAFELPIFYLATKIKPENKFECFAPIRQPEDKKIDYLISWARNHCDECRNPVLKSDIARKRRKTLKTLFKLPI